MRNKKFRPTTYIVEIWNKENTEQIGQELYPMHKYSFDDVKTLLKGRESICDIYEGRFCKIGKGHWIMTGNLYVWDGNKWVNK